MNKFGKLEKKYVTSALNSGNLFYHKGKMTKRFLSKVKSHFKVKYAATMSSGTAALHCAVGALEIPPGYEVITSSITDMGTLIGILYQNLIPVFSDVDPHTYNITADSIKKVMTDRTRAIIVVHLTGNPAEMEDIMNLAHDRNIPVIEDCAQSYGAFHRGKSVGTWGDIGCFSLNAFKHINSGDGGFAITNNEEYFYRLHNFADKCYDRHGTGNRLTQLAPNYRITELQSAVALAQFKKVTGICQKRKLLGNKFNRGIEGLSGVYPHQVNDHNDASYWFSMIRVNPEELSCTRKEFVKSLQKRLVFAGEGYIEKPIYLESMFVNKSFFPGGVWPAEIIAGRSYEYKEGLCPVAEEVLKTAIKIPIEEIMGEKMIDGMIKAVKTLHKKYSL